MSRGRGRPPARGRSRPPNHFSRPPQPPSLPPGASGKSSCLVLIVGALAAVAGLGEVARWLT